MKICNECGGKHYAKGKCRLHYKMPSQINPKPIKSKITFVVESSMAMPKTFQSISISKLNRRLGDTKKSNEDKSTNELKKLAQTVVNRFIRRKYARTDGTTKCYTCLKWVSSKDIDASHFISVRHQGTRYDLNNIRACCTYCNRPQYGELKLFRQHLVQEIGESAVEELEIRSKEHKHWSKEELLELITKYK